MNEFGIIAIVAVATILLLGWFARRQMDEMYSLGYKHGLQDGFKQCSEIDAPYLIGADSIKPT